MKRTLPFLLFFSFSIFINAQSIPKILDGPTIVPHMPQPSPLPEIREVGVPPASPIDFRDEEEVRIGITRFETQTIGSLGRRVAALPDGRVSAAWLHGLDENGGWPDRGTAYNQFNGVEWGDEPDMSLEQTRSGYPSFTSTPNGLEVVISHKNTTADSWFLQSHTKMPDETTWTETEIPSTVPGGPVWAKVATGGPDGNTIHAVAVSLATAFGGVVYEGMDQHPLYYRSTDNGTTWDMVDVVVPGLDSNFYLDVAGEAYNIAARGETVAIGVFDAWGDIAIFKSTDNGMTWNKHVILDHPLDKYDGSGYGPGDVPYDPVPDDSISIFSSDYSGSVLIDNDGKVHVFFSTMYHFATGPDLFLNLVTDGIAYWNEDMGTGDVEIIAAAPDIDGDGVVTVEGAFADLRYNNTNFTSFPTSSIDDDGNLYLVFSTLREDLVSFEQTTYRHVFIVKSEDGGATWSEPFDLINPDVTEFYDFIEGVYASIPTHIGDKIDMVYKQDFEPGQTPQGTMIAEQFIMHVTYDKNTFEPSFADEIEQLKGEMTLSPNPATDLVSLEFELNEKADATFRIYDALGNQVHLREMNNLLAGLNKETFDVSSLSRGLYFLQIVIDGAQQTKKLVVRAGR